MFNLRQNLYCVGAIFLFVFVHRISTIMYTYYCGNSFLNFFYMGSPVCSFLITTILKCQQYYTSVWGLLAISTLNIVKHLYDLTLFTGRKSLDIGVNKAQINQIH